jgi:hypothetical protein
VTVGGVIVVVTVGDVTVLTTVTVRIAAVVVVVTVSGAAALVTVTVSGGTVPVTLTVRPTVAVVVTGETGAFGPSSPTGGDRPTTSAPMANITTATDDIAHSVVTRISSRRCPRATAPARSASRPRRLREKSSRSRQSDPSMLPGSREVYLRVRYTQFNVSGRHVKDLSDNASGQTFPGGQN